MNIGGLIKSSLIDFPGKVSCVVFTQGCNFHCPYCHNPGLVPSSSTDGLLSEGDVLGFLEKRKGLLDGVVITGGEPTLRKGLVDFIRKVRTMGFKVKLDTNGSNPQVLRVLLSEKLVDYVAMDVKTDPYLYAPSLWGKNDPETILSSISVIMDSNCRYEFRTTCVRPFVDEGIITRIGEWINGAEKYVLQPYSSAKTLDPDFTHRENAAYSEKELQKFKALADSFVGECVIR